jgi:ketosteroid isomerase-like protein
MRRFEAIAFALLGTCLFAVAQNLDTTKELIAAEHRFNDALLRADWKMVEQIFAEDLVVTNSDGSVTHKSDELKSVKSGDEKLESIEISDVRVQDLGDVAVVTGKLVEKGRYKTTDVSGSYRFTDVWAKRNGRWQLVAGQETLYTPGK